MRRANICILAGFLVLSGISSPPSQAAQGKAGVVTLTEAEILIYFLPEALQVRADGMDVGWEEDSTPANNQKDYYYFFVYNAKRPAETANVTIGHFAVNKHTADVWDAITFEAVSSKEISGIQRILRRAHRIDQKTIERYRSVVF